MNPLYKDGWPNPVAIKAAFPLHGAGQIDQTSTSGEVFSYRVENIGGLYWIVIVTQPSYRGRIEDLQTTHRIPLPQGGFRICVTREPTDLPSAVTLALMWGECTSRYIHTGARF